MSFNVSKQRLYASLLILGACILLFRTITMLSQGALDVLVLWVSVLLIVELLIDTGCILSSVRWWITNDESKARIPLRIGAAAAILHSARVLIFVLGRVGPWIDFDVRPEHRALHSTPWSWGWLYFAAIMSVLGVIGAFIIWILRRRAKKKIDN
ncbi:hypothetical protein CEE34_00325 [Candidatus Aerophobetes bacterium Ae_b3a]|nr:MAG: hypothetical protein CEE34_00325 [Candidatus Aerophobetes bacterium Ae_b3a]